MVSLISANAGVAGITPGLVQGWMGLFAALLKESAVSADAESIAAEHPLKGEGHHARGEKQDEHPTDNDIAADSTDVVNIVPVMVTNPSGAIETKPVQEESGGTAGTPELPLTGVEQKMSPKPASHNPKKEKLNTQVNEAEGEGMSQAQHSFPSHQLPLSDKETPVQVARQDMGAVSGTKEQSAERRSNEDRRDVQKVDAPASNGATAQFAKAAPEKVEVKKADVSEIKRASIEKEAGEPKSPAASISSREPKVVIGADSGLDGVDRTRQVTPSKSESSPVIAVVDVGEQRSVPPMAMNTQRLVEHLGGAEMKFTVRMNESGQVQVTTNVHDRTMELGMVVDRAETVSALRSEVPYLENRLRGQSVELGDVRIAMNETANMNAGYSGEQRSRQEWRNPSLAFRPGDARDAQPEAGGSGAGSDVAVSGWLA